VSGSAFAVSLSVLAGLDIALLGLGAALSLKR
jgi:hypothetical protein